MKPKILLTTIAATLGAVSILTLEGALGNTGPIKTECETYQGYREESSDGTVSYVFDPVPFYERAGDTRFWLRGNPRFKDSLLNGEAIGTRFCFTYVDPINPLSSKKLREIHPDTSGTGAE